MEFLIAVTDDKFHQVISAKGNASKLVTILSNNSGRLVKVRDAKIAFLFQAERRLTDTSTQPNLRDIRHKQWRNSERKRPAQRFEACDGREPNGFDADFPFCSTVFF